MDPDTKAYLDNARSLCNELDFMLHRDILLDQDTRKVKAAIKNVLCAIDNVEKLTVGSEEAAMAMTDLVALVKTIIELE
jgi:hypothetical protein